MHWLIRALLDIVFPPRCEVCQRFGPTPLCSECAGQIRRILPPFCHICGEAFDPQARGGPICSDCRGRRHSFQLARAFGFYEGPLRKAIHRFKYQGQRVLARPLGALLTAHLRDNSPSAADGSSAPPPPSIPLQQLDLICPVPLFPARQRARGFNQAELICRALSRATDISLRTGVLQRVRDTLPQVHLPASQRAANVRGAFAAPQPETVRGKTVLLVDDVFTTGATLRECARTLQRAGACAVFALALARPRPAWLMPAEPQRGGAGSVPIIPELGLQP